MESRWNDEEAAACSDDVLALRVYGSRLLGSDEALVMHGGGNTSAKGVVRDFFGDEIEVLFVKGSGWDLATIEAEGFPALRLAETARLAELPTLSDPDMTKLLRLFTMDPASPSPSVETILHAIVPTRFVDHTHTDAVVTITNNPRREEILAEIYSDCLVLPYVMPGFLLARQVHEAINRRDFDPATCKGIILLNHGVFTFDDDPRVAYEDMIELVTRAEDYLAAHGVGELPTATHPVDLLDLARIRKAVSRVRGCAQLAILDASPEAQGFASLPDVAEIARRGPITPDHVIRTKRVPVVIAPVPADDVPEVEAFADDYRAYYERHRTEGLQMLDPAPRFAVWKDRGTIAFGDDRKACGVVSDIVRHTRRCIVLGESIGGWQALPEEDLFELEYWVLEQAKLGKPTTRKPHQGQVAIVTGAASGIGRATSRALAADGATVVGLDLDPDVASTLEAEGMIGIRCDLREDEAVRAAIEEAVRRFGGLDLLVCNAGIFRSGQRIEALDASSWDAILETNLTATRRVMSASIPFLRHGVDPAIVVVGSRNQPAPGPGAAAYSVSKAGVTQLARVAALELAADGIRVNVVHPDAVFDTGAWTEEALETSAARYGMSVEEYRNRNLLGVEIRADDVARAISVLASDVFRATTGAQLPIDGGNERVI